MGQACPTDRVRCSKRRGSFWAEFAQLGPESGVSCELTVDEGVKVGNESAMKALSAHVSPPTRSGCCRRWPEACGRPGSGCSTFRSATRSNQRRRLSPKTLRRAVPGCLAIPNDSRVCPSFVRRCPDTSSAGLRVEVDPETQVLPTAGAKEAIFSSALAFVDRDRRRCRGVGNPWLPRL